MSIFKKFASLFSSPAAAPTASAPAPVISAQEAEVLTELESSKCELAEKKVIEKARLAVLKEETEGAIRMRQAEQALVTTYRALSSCEDRLEIIEDSIQQAREHRESAALSALDMARKLKQERMDKKMAKLGGAPVPRYIPTAPRVRNTSASSNFIVCPACNTPNHEANTHCDACGTLLVQPAPAPTTPPVVTGNLPSLFNVSQNQQP